MDETKTKYVIFRESLWQSVTSDVVTYVMMVGAFGFNHFFIGSAFLNFVILFLLMWSIVARAKLKMAMFTDLDEAIKHLESFRR